MVNIFVFILVINIYTTNAWISNVKKNSFIKYKRDIRRKTIICNRNNFQRLKFKQSDEIHQPKEVDLTLSIPVEEPELDQKAFTIMTLLFFVTLLGAIGI